MKDAQIGIIKVIEVTSGFFLKQVATTWVQAVTHFLPQTVLGIEVQLTSGNATKQRSSADFIANQPGGRTASSWLLNGLLSNPVPIVDSNQQQLHDVPEIPMVIIHKWLTDPGKPITENYLQIQPYVAEMWKRTQVFFHAVKKHAWKRYEGVMACWFGLVLHCAHKLKRNLRLCAKSACSDCAVLFPQFTMSSAEDIVFKHPAKYKEFRQRVIELPHKISGPKAGEIPPSCSCKGDACVFVCKPDRLVGLVTQKVACLSASRGDFDTPQYIVRVEV